MSVVEVGSGDTAVVSGVTGELLRLGYRGHRAILAVAVLAQAYFVVLMVYGGSCAVVRYGLDVEAAAFTPV